MDRKLPEDELPHTVVARRAFAFADAMQAVAERNENLEGIPLYLALEGTEAETQVTSRDVVHRELGAIALGYLHDQLGGRRAATLGDLAGVFKVLGARHFELAGRPAERLPPAPPDDEPDGLEDGPPPVLIDDVTAAWLLTQAPWLRAINFHNTPARERRRYEAQLAGLGERFGPVDEDALEQLMGGEALPCGRPGLLPVFYEGYRNNLEVALELVEREGLVAWFFVPSAFPDVPVAEQHSWAREHLVGLAGDDPQRVALTWAELREIVARGHVVACHTATHSGTLALRTPADIERELVASKATLEAQLGVDIRTLAWLWGSPTGLDAQLDARLVELGYRFVFSNAKIQRLGPAPAAPPRRT